MTFKRRQALLSAATFAGFFVAACAHTAAFTAEQSGSGAADYQRYCAECHHGSLRGSGHGVPLRGEAFLAKWSSQPFAELWQFVRGQMAMTVPPSVPDSTYTNILAYVLQENGVPVGSVALRADDQRPLLAAAGQAASGASSAVAAAEPVADEAGPERQEWRGAAGVAEAAARVGARANRPTPPLRPVSEALLDNPPDESWLSWRRTRDGQGYSPLAQINKDSVSKLRLAWALTMREGSNQGTPLVHDGVMYLTHPGNVIQALDAATGELYWEYAYPHPEPSRTLGGPTRNIAIYGDKIFLATYDAALVAINAQTGEPLWRTVKADYTQGYTHTAGPIIAAGIVVSGINGCEQFHQDLCFITGHDPDTGEELWRTSTIATPDDPNDASWGDIPVGLRGGSDNWIAGSYDPETGLYFLGTSQAKPWVAASRGMTPKDAALYTNSTLALDPKTGELRWYYQHIPGETLDMETGFERVLVNHDDQHWLFTAGKDGLLWKLDRATGQFLGFQELLYQNLYERLDHENGRVHYREDILAAGIGDPVSVCPSIYGGHNWQAMAYSPEQRSLVIPLHQLCVTMVGREVEMREGGGGYGGESEIFHMPGVEGKLGKLVAHSTETLEPLWTHEQEAMFMTGALTTAGGLVFIGDLDRYFKAFDVATGELAWSTRLGAPTHGFPITFAVDGRQFIAVQTGMGVFRLMTARQSPQIYQPNGGNQIYVFELTP